MHACTDYTHNSSILLVGCHYRITQLHQPSHSLHLSVSHHAKHRSVPPHRAARVMLVPAAARGPWLSQAGDSVLSTACYYGLCC